MLSSASARSLGCLHSNDHCVASDTPRYSRGRPPCNRQRCKVAFAREYSSEASHNGQAHSASEQLDLKAQECVVPDTKLSSSRHSPAQPASSSTKSSKTRSWRSGSGSGHRWPWFLWSAGDATSSSSSTADHEAASRQQDSTASYSPFPRRPAAAQQCTGRKQLQSKPYQTHTVAGFKQDGAAAGAVSAAAVVTHTAVISSSSYLRRSFIASSSADASGGSSTSTSSSWEESAAALRCVEDTLEDSSNVGGLDSSQLFLYDLMPPAAAEAISADLSGSSSSSKLALLLGDTYPFASADGQDGPGYNPSTSASAALGLAAAGSTPAAAAGGAGNAAGTAAAAAAPAVPSDHAALQRQLRGQGRHWTSGQHLEQRVEQHGWSLSLNTTSSSHSVPVPNAASLQRTLKAAGPLRQPSSSASPSSSSSNSSSASPSSSSDDADWLTAVLSAPTSRLSSHSNAVLTNSLKRLASLRSSGGALAGSSAAAVVNTEGLLDSIRARFGSFQLQQFEEVALQLAQLEYLPDEAWLAAFERSSMSVMPGGSPRLLSRLLLSRSKLGGQVSSEWCAACCQHMAAAPDRLSVSSWVNALCALVRLQHTPNRHFQTTFLSATAERLDDVSPELLTQLVWSLSRLKLSPSYIWWRSLVRATASIEKPFSHGQLASLVHSAALWAEPCGIAAQDAQRFVDMLLVEIHDQLGLLQPAELTRVVWSLGSLVAARKLQPDRALFEELLEAIQGQLPRLNPVQCSNLCWGLAKLNHKLSKGFADALLLEVQAQLSGFSSSNLCSVMWALAKLKLMPPPPFRQQLWEELHSRIKGLELESLSTLSWSLAQLQLQPPGDILADVCEHSRALLPDCDAAHLTNIVWALGRLGARPDCEWLEAAEESSMQVLPAAGLKQVVNLAWGMCCICSHPAARVGSTDTSQCSSGQAEHPGLSYTPSAAWQAACLRELRLRCMCAGVDTDCKQLVQMLRDLGVNGFAYATAAVADQLFAEQDEFEACCSLQFQPGCQ